MQRDGAARGKPSCVIGENKSTVRTSEAGAGAGDTAGEIPRRPAGGRARTPGARWTRAAVHRTPETGRIQTLAVGVPE